MVKLDSMSVPDGSSFSKSADQQVLKSTPFQAVLIAPLQVGGTTPRSRRLQMVVASKVGNGRELQR